MGWQHEGWWRVSRVRRDGRCPDRPLTPQMQCYLQYVTLLAIFRDRLPSYFRLYTLRQASQDIGRGIMN